MWKYYNKFEVANWTIFGWSLRKKGRLFEVEVEKGYLEVKIVSGREFHSEKIFKFCKRNH